MNRFLKLFRYEVKNVSRNKWVFVYGLLLALLGGALIWIGGSFNKAILSIANLVVVLVPLMSLLFTTVYWYYNERYAHLLLTQPLSRTEFLWARFSAVALVLGLSSAIGLALPFLSFGHFNFGVFLNSLVAFAFSVMFVAIGLLIATGTGDRMKGIGLTLGVWMGATLVYDGFILMFLLALKEYPVDIPATVAATLNPVGLGRVVLLMYHDGALLLGYSGTMVRRLLTSPAGYVAAAAVAGMWMTLPLLVTWRRFRRKDF